MNTQEILIGQLLEELKQLREENKFLKERVAELERRLNLNSNNSSKPPSSDGLKKKSRNNSLREKGKNKSGGQSKHRGSTLAQTKEPDKKIVYKLDSCLDCGKDLKRIKPLNIVKRQIFDLVLPSIEVTEHQTETKCCPACKQKSSTIFPIGVNAPVQYGPVIKSLSVYLQNQHYIPEKRLQGIFKDVFGLHLTTSTFSNFNEKLVGNLEPVLSSIDKGIYKAAVKHLDETGFRVENKQKWLHVACTDKLTSYRLDKRGNVPSKMLGVIVHDHFRSYFNVHKAKHAICNAHIMRELMAIIENDKEVWAKNMFKLLRLACRVKNKYTKGIPRKWQAFIANKYYKLVAIGLAYHSDLVPLNTKARRTGHNLLLRLEHYAYETLRFLYDVKVPFTNNQAEQDLRMMKVKQKVSGCFRADHGATTFCKIRSFISTARKQGWNILDAINHAFCAQIPSLTLA